MLLALVALAAWASWRGSRSLETGKRALLLTLRTLAVAALAALLLNPGRWVRPTDERESPWLVLLDRSASMSQPLGDGTRIGEATKLAAQAVAIAPPDVPVRVRPFASSVDAALEDIESAATADGDGTDLVGSLKSLAEEAAATGDRFAGVVVLSDGRQTVAPTDAQLESLTLRFRARRTALHAVAIGAGEPLRDLALRATRPTVTVFTGQTARVPFVVEASGLGELKPEVILENADGEELARTQVEVSDGSPAFASFEVDAPAEGARWSLRTAAVPGEVRAANNVSAVNIRVLHSRTRVFLAEGAPYWDSKFLAQLLRQQSHMEVHSVHRISEDRFFRIDTGESDATETDDAVFPDTLEALSAYDLIVFGKNVDSFLTPARLDALRVYIRDRGGAVLFARGKATTSTMPALEALEPVTWAATRSDRFRFVPTPDGEAAGLFGEALPPPDASVWSNLPELQDARTVSFVKPFTRILAEGSTEGGFAGKTPVLLVRRYGQGVCGLVNGDGLWKWDFYPEARELGNMYEDFWTQLIQWMASYSEFLPGQDFSLRLPASRGRVDDPVSVQVSYRGRDADPQPGLVIESPAGETTELRPATQPDPGGHPTWRATFHPDRPGQWRLRVTDPRDDAPPAPEAAYLVPAPPNEADDLSPDPAFLASLAESTGGALHTAAELPDFLAEAFQPEPPAERSGGAVWQSSWAIWPVAVAIAALFAAEWYLRRRQGLA